MAEGSGAIVESPHYVRDYRALVQRLLETRELDIAMAAGVGGPMEWGRLELAILRQYGLGDYDRLVDVGCGSGRLTRALLESGWQGEYDGFDVVPEFLAYAKSGCPGHWNFKVVDGLTIPLLGTGLGRPGVDMVCFFSVLTHLKPEEGYCYLLEAMRVLRAGGRIVVSFLEWGPNWSIFEDMVTAVRRGDRPVHLNTFLSEEVIRMWAGKLGLKVVGMHGSADAFIELPEPVWIGDRWLRDQTPLGQAVAVLEV